MPLVRKASSRSRLERMSKLNSTSSKICLSGLNRVTVPLPGRLADHCHRGLGDAAHVALEMDLAVLVDRHLAPLGQGVHDRGAHAVQAAGDLVGGLVELAPRVELGHDDLEGAHLLGGVDVHGDAAAVVLDGDHVALAEVHGDGRALSDQGLVDGVVDDLEDELVQAVQAGRADVHARPFADVLETLENLDIVCAVGVVHGNAGAGTIDDTFFCRKDQSEQRCRTAPRGTPRGPRKIARRHLRDEVRSTTLRAKGCVNKLWILDAQNHRRWHDRFQYSH